MEKELQKLVISEDGKELIEEIKTVLKLNPGDTVKIMHEPRYFVIYKSEPACFTCGSEKNLHTLGNKITLCEPCLRAVCSVAFKDISEEEQKNIAKELQEDIK